MDVTILTSCQFKPKNVHKSWERMINTKRKMCSARTNACMTTIPKQDGTVRTFTTMSLFDYHDKFRILSTKHYYYSSQVRSASQLQLPSLSQKYSFSSSSNTKSTNHNPRQSDSINLIHLIPQQTLDTIQTLPEVQQILSIIREQKTTTIHGMTTKTTILESIDRAIQIFQHVGVEEHKAMLVLKAMYLSQICHYQKCCHVLSTILTTYYCHENKDITTNQEKKYVLSSLAKMNWYNGSFISGLEYANILDEMISSTKSNSLSSQQIIFETGCTMNTIALCKLLSTERIKDVDILQLTTKIEQDDWKECQDEYFQIQSMLENASQMLENAYLELQQEEHDTTSRTTTTNNDLEIQLALSCASSYCNQGIVSLILNMMNNNNKPNDSALNNWKQGLYILKEFEQQQKLVMMESSSAPNFHYVYLCKLIQARIYCNMTWSILFQSLYHHKIDDNNNNAKLQKSPPLKEEELKMASEYASLALKEHDDLMQLLSKQENSNQSNSYNQELQVLMGRTLGLVASCYARAGSAVTAEGLLQSAMDTYKHPSLKDKKLNPLVQIDSRSASLYYLSLCRNWEKRDSDAKLYEHSALLINDGILCDNWRDICAIYSGLCLFTMSDFQ